MYVAYSYPLGQPAIPALGAHTPITELPPQQILTAVTSPSIADPYLVPVTAAPQPLQATAAAFQPLTLAVCRKVRFILQIPVNVEKHYHGLQLISFIK